MNTLMNTMDKHIINLIKNKIDQSITNQCLPVLMEYIAIPCKSPAFDPEWEKNGYLDAAMQLLFDYTKKQNIAGLSAEIIRLEHRTPLLFIDIPASPNIPASNTVLLYGHMDKQPEMSGWDPDKGPWRPVLQDDKLYGRGGADDGYALFSALLAIEALEEHKIPHARCVIIIEACEESGSYDLPAYLDALSPRIGTPNLVICLDSSAGNYEQLWCTTSLRGIIGGQLDIQVTKEGIHSGLGSGVVPPIELILRQLLNRLEDPNTGQIIPPEFSVKIPKQRIDEAKQVAQQLGTALLHSYPFIGDTQAVSQDVHELILNRSWRSQLSITGLEGYPKLRDAGNVTLPKASLKLSLRIPPTADAEQLSQALKKLLETHPPFNAYIRFTPNEAANGWHAPETSPWLLDACEQASQEFFGQSAAYFGEGGIIPFMGMLGHAFPKVQFMITGVLGPRSNAHGPNEFLHLTMMKKITGCVAQVIASQANSS